jgi:hypothetical protein
MSRAAFPGTLATIAFGTAAFGQSIDTVERTWSDVPATAEKYSDMWTNAQVRVSHTHGTTTESPLGYEMLMSNPSANGASLLFETPDGTMLANIAGQMETDRSAIDSGFVPVLMDVPAGLRAQIWPRPMRWATKLRRVMEPVRRLRLACRTNPTATVST